MWPCLFIIRTWSFAYRMFRRRLVYWCQNFIRHVTYAELGKLLFKGNFLIRYRYSSLSQKSNLLLLLVINSEKVIRYRYFLSIR